VKVYCAFDSDYYTSQQLDCRRQQACAGGIQLKIWNKKEIENYLLVPTAIARAAARSGRKALPSAQQIREQLDKTAERYRSEVVVNMATEIQKTNSKLSVKSAMQTAETTVSKLWGTFEGKMARISGSSALGELNRWLANYKISITPAGIASELTVDEIHEDLKEFFERFEYGEEF
jgi:hypothetical protein